MFFRYDPDEWRPSRQDPQHHHPTSTGRLEPNAIVVWQRKPYRLLEVREMLHANWPEQYREAWVKQGMPDPDTWAYRPRVVVLRSEDDPKAKPVHLARPDSTYWYTLPEHYAICRLCHELPPCQHVHNESIMERATERMNKEMAILPGTCHGCREPITKRQKAFTFPGANLIRPDLGDNSAIFHTRSDCYNSLDSYDERWAAAEEGRRRFFQCDGTLTTHYDGTTECTTPDCAAKGSLGGLVRHRMGIRHHPRGVRVVQGCWCLAAVA